MEAIPVTAAVIERDGKILIARRLPTKAFPGKWEFPGGKIEPNETPEMCLVREIREEFDVTPEIERKVLDWDFDYGNGKKFRFCSFRCSISGEPKLLAHSAMAWVTPDELSNFDLLEADKILAEVLKRQ